MESNFRLGAALLTTALFSATLLYAAPPDPNPPPPPQGTTGRLTVNREGTQGNASSGQAAISSNARLVVIESDASNLIPTDTNGKKDIFLRDQKTGEIKRVGDGPNSMQSNGDSSKPFISPKSPNGFVAISFTSTATNLDFLSALPDTNGIADIYLHLPVLKFTSRVSIASGLAEANGPSSSPSVTISPAPDRVLVAYASDATNLSGTDGNAARVEKRWKYARFVIAAISQSRA